jgi:hypothetical protein
MFTLNDKTIRKSLIARLSKLSKAPGAILEELRVHNGNAIADVVSVHSWAHCYEIKGDTDSVQRILRQSHYYDLAFKKTTLVTTDKQIDRARRFVPPYWGIMLARESAGEVKLCYVRPAKQSPSFDRKLALLTLWRSELIDVALTAKPAVEKLGKLNRAQLTELIALNLGNDSVVKSIGEKLILRQN